MRAQDLDVAEGRIRKELDDGSVKVRDLRAQVDAMEEALKGHTAVALMIGALRICYSPPALFYPGYPRCFFVVDYTLDVDGVLVDVSGLIVESVVRDGKWYKPFPTDRPGVQTMRAVPVPAAEVARTVAGLYADRKVRLGEFLDVRHEPCMTCGKDALLVGVHEFDHESEWQTIKVDRLCLACPCMDRVAEASLDSDKPHPALPPKG